jgi:hypothetical protein
MRARSFFNASSLWFAGTFELPGRKLIRKPGICTARNPIIPDFPLASVRKPAAQSPPSRENLLEMLRIDAVNLLHPGVVVVRRLGWRRAMLFVNFSNRNFECHMFPRFVVLQSFVHFSVDYEELAGLQMPVPCRPPCSEARSAVLRRNTGCI